MWPGLHQHPPHTHACTSATSRHPREACAAAEPPVIRHGSSPYKLQRRCRHQPAANVALHGLRLRNPCRPRQRLRIAGLLRLGCLAITASLAPDEDTPTFPPWHCRGPVSGHVLFAPTHASPRPRFAQPLFQPSPQSNPQPRSRYASARFWRKPVR